RLAASAAVVVSVAILLRTPRSVNGSRLCSADFRGLEDHTHPAYRQHLPVWGACVRNLRGLRAPLPPRLWVHQLVLVGHPTPGCGGSFAGGGFRGGMTSPGVVDATGGGVSSIDCC